VSIGAINASIFSVYPPGEEKAAAKAIASVYENYSSSDLFTFYKPIILAPFKHNSLADLKGLHHVLDE